MNKTQLKSIKFLKLLRNANLLEERKKFSKAKYQDYPTKDMLILEEQSLPSKARMLS
jgi:hypothetical protein